jgi:hypothetical protein
VRRARALVRAPHDRTALAAAALRNDIHRLVARLQNALELSEQDCGAWQETLLALAHQAPRGLWTVEARLLYDLQKVCVDHERAIYAVDPIEWLLWLGRRPLKRPLGSQREVLMAKHLATAQGRLAAVCIADRLRRQLSGLLRAAREQAEARLRRHFGPRIAQIIDQVGLQPQNLPERVAKQKLVQELLDRITERGLLTLGDLRDALSRNHLKQPDCGGLRDFLRGDALLRADRRLAVALDGVYHRGEIYLLAIQRFSLAAFGTRWGRWLTLNLASPFGGAYVILAAVDHFVHLITGLEPALAPTLLEPGSYAPNLLLGLFLLGLIRGPGFRRWVWRAVRAAGRAARFLLIDCVGRLLELPWLQRILHSRWTRLALAWLVKPALPTLIYWRLLPPPSALRQGSGALAMVFLASALILNSRLGRNLEELLVDRVVEGWHRFGVRFFSGLFWFVVDLFRLLLETIERLLYGVDEWLRFRAGQGRAVLVAKAALGTAWFFVAYTVRFCVNLLLEPQFNPIKHVPVVTVSHKCIAPLSKVVFEALLAHGLRRTAATATTFVIIFGTPGIFGFLVWELKENWRLFAANRPSGLGPAPIGQHGETMPRLVRPGFHSGTIPKRLARLRRAERQALAGGDWRRVRKHRDALGRVELALRRYAQRELVELLAESRRWEGPPPVVGEIRLATNRVRIALRLAGPAEGRLWIAFEIESGWLLGDVASGDVGGDRSHPCEAPAGPLRGTWDLSASSRQALRLALTGLCKTAGVELLRAQLADEDGTRNGRVLPERPSELALSGQEGLPLPPGMQHVFAQVPIPWADWVAAWEEDSM